MRFDRTVILTGAGLSAESGLGTFRDKGGLWSQFPLEEVATPEGFARDPARVHNFYNFRRRRHRDAQPNAAHAALARLEREHAGAVLTVTQNIGCWDTQSYPYPRRAYACAECGVWDEHALERGPHR